MLDWLTSTLFGAGYWLGSQLRSLLSSLFSALTGWLQGILGADRDAWTQLWAAFNGLSDDTDYFGNRVWLNLNWTGRHVLPGIRRYVDLFNQRQDAWNARWHALLWQRDEANHAFTVSEVDGAKTWALLLIFKPLMALVTILIKEMIEWAYFAFSLLTDLPKLSGLLLWPLTAAFEAAWWTWSRTVGDWVGKLILHNLLKSVQLVEQLLADIL